MGELLAHLTATETAVLRYLASLGGDCAYGYVGFAPICRETKLERKIVRRACRSLKRKGFAEFSVGLFTEDGDMAGAGYAATNRGALLVEPVDE